MDEWNPLRSYPTQDNPLVSGAPSLADAWRYNTAAAQQWLAAQRAQSAQMGLWNPQTGLPTHAGVVQAAGQWANGVMMGSTAPKAIGGKGTTIYRAHDAREDLSKIHRYSSWSPDKATAEAYMDNPGFGGPSLRSAEIDLSRVLDVNPRSERGLRELARQAGYENPDEVATDWWNRNIQYPWEEIGGIKQGLLRNGHEWIRYEDDFPSNGAVTVVPLIDIDLAKGR